MSGPARRIRRPGRRVPPDREGRHGHGQQRVPDQGVHPSDAFPQGRSVHAPTVARAGGSGVILREDVAGRVRHAQRGRRRDTLSPEGHHRARRARRSPRPRTVRRLAATVASAHLLGQGRRGGHRNDRVMFAVRTVATILLLVVISLVLAVGAEPPVAWLTGKGLRRGVAVLDPCSERSSSCSERAWRCSSRWRPPTSGCWLHRPGRLSVAVAGARRLGGRVPATEHRQSRRRRPSWKNRPRELGASMGTLLASPAEWAPPLLALGTIAVLTVYFMCRSPALRARARMLFRPEIRDRVEPVHRAVADADRRLRGAATVSRRSSPR